MPAETAALDLVAEVAAEMSDPYGSELVVQALEQGAALGPDRLLRLCLAARHLERLGVVAAARCALGGEADPTAALCDAIGAIGRALVGRFEPLAPAASDRYGPGCVNQINAP